MSDLIKLKKYTINNDGNVVIETYKIPSIIYYYKLSKLQNSLKINMQSHTYILHSKTYVF